jgi:rubrerythrin
MGVSRAKGYIAPAGPCSAFLLDAGQSGNYNREKKPRFKSRALIIRGEEMDVFDYAMQLERDGESYYRDAAARSANKGLRNILVMLADAEVKHFDTFKQMKDNRPAELADATILQDVKNIFITMREEGGLEGLAVAEIELYKGAQEIEKKTETFYLEKADQVVDTAQSEAFRRIANEENKHYLILEQIIEFVSRPSHWLENAEWYHLDEY